MSISSLLHEKSKDYQNVSSGRNIFDVMLLLANIIMQTFTIVITSKATLKNIKEERGGILTQL